MKNKVISKISLRNGMICKIEELKIGDPSPDDKEKAAREDMQKRHSCNFIHLGGKVT
jgi:hypothetical protein